LQPLLSTPGLHWINLQYGERAAEIAGFKANHNIEIADWPEAIDGDYDETAALVSALDLVISVCTRSSISPARWAGGMGDGAFCAGMALWPKKAKRCRGTRRSGCFAKPKLVHGIPSSPPSIRH